MSILSDGGHKMKQALIVSVDDLDTMTAAIIAGVTDHLEKHFHQGRTEQAVGREEMAKLLGVGLATIDRGVRDGSIPSMLLNSRRMFLPSEVYAALKVDRAA